MIQQCFMRSKFLVALPALVGAALTLYFRRRRPNRLSLQQRPTLMQRAALMLEEYLSHTDMLRNPVVRLTGRDALESAFAEAGIAMELAAGEPGAEQALLERAIELALAYSVRSGSPHFFNSLYGRPDPVGIVGDWTTACVHANAYTFENAPVFTVMEHHVLARFARAVGPRFEATHDGLMVPGGSLGNLYAMHLARHRAAPEIHSEGAAGGPTLVAFVSSQAHYSYLKSARLLGLGARNLVTVACDAEGRMDLGALRTAIREAEVAGKTPFFVGATAGTTVRGAFDPLRALATLCTEAQPRQLWLHVDAAWGGGALFSPAWRHLLDGADAADSISWSAHKALGITHQAACFLTAHVGALRAANASGAIYLFQKDKLNAELDQGDKTIQCGRRADMFKLWLVFKSLGDAGVARRIDHSYALAEHLARCVRDSGGAFRLAYPPSCTNVCFWYVPRVMRPLPAALTAGHPLHGVAVTIKARLQEGGHAMVGFLSQDDKPNFFRWIFSSTDGACAVSAEAVDTVLQKMAQLGEECFP